MDKFQRGFTLIEAILVMVITGIIASVVAVFILHPVQGYFDSVRRAEMTDTADTALRRIGRDLRLALPNSVRVTSVANTYSALEFLPTSQGGRYRADFGDAGNENILDFTTADTSFEILGADMTFASGDQIVIYNLGIDGANAYSGNAANTDNRRAYNGAIGSAVSTVTITSLQPLPFDSPSHRFHVINTPVTYFCDLTAKTLRRYSGYAISPNQPVAFAAGTSSALLAQNITNCAFTYEPGISERNGLVTLSLSITETNQSGANETVTLYHETHVSNVP